MNVLSLDCPPLEILTKSRLALLEPYSGHLQTKKRNFPKRYFQVDLRQAFVLAGNLQPPKYGHVVLFLGNCGP